MLSEDIIFFLIRHKVEAIQIIETKSIHLYMYQHALQVALIATLIGMQMKLTFLELKVLFLSALIMEVSNVVVPNDILFKKNKLSQEELELVKSHTQFCHKELSDSKHVHYLVKLICSQHHEKLDGSGYPKGLKNNDIHILSQIIAVADTFDALISDRNQREAFSIFETLNYLESQVNILYSENIVSVLRKITFPLSIGETIELNIGTGVVTHYDENVFPVVEITKLKKKIVLDPSGPIKIRASKIK